MRGSGAILYKRMKLLWWVWKLLWWVCMTPAVPWVGC